MTEQSFEAHPDQPRRITLQDLLVHIVLPGDEARKRARPDPGFSPEVQAQLNRDLAASEAMVVDTRWHTNGR